MGKTKTKKAAAKRVRVTRRGKVMMRHAGQNHLLCGKRRKRKRQASKDGQLQGRDARRMRTLSGN